MTPIINPWIFYIFSVIDKIQVINILSLAILGFFLFACFICLSDELSSSYKSKDDKRNVMQFYKKTIKYPLIIFILNLFLLLLVPGKETLTKMLLANVITYENVDAGVDTTREMIDYIFDKIDGIDEEKANE